jgi:hypothetical protein
VSTGPSGSSLPEPATHWIVPLRTLAVTSGVFGFTCLGVLVVVTAIDSVDALSTVALALAILAFSVQLIVFAAQQNLASEQARRNEELYGSMQGVLAEVREKAAGTQEDVRTINEKMLGAILSKTLVEGSRGPVDYSQLATQVAREASAAEQTSGLPDLSEVIWPRRKVSAEDQPHRELLETFPPEDEASDLLAHLMTVPPIDRMSLKAFGEDELRALSPDSPFNPSLPLNIAYSLPAMGLVEPYPAEEQPAGGPVIMRLTDDGRNLARLLTADEPIPSYLAPLRGIRDELDPEQLRGESDT